MKIYKNENVSGKEQGIVLIRTNRWVKSNYFKRKLMKTKL